MNHYKKSKFIGLFTFKNNSCNTYIAKEPLGRENGKTGYSCRCEISKNVLLMLAIYE